MDFPESRQHLVEWFKGDIGQVCTIRFTLGSPVIAAILAQCSLLYLLFCLSVSVRKSLNGKTFP